MRYPIDVNECCQKGLSIVWDKWKAWEAADHRALLELARVEKKHLEECATCNPDIGVDGFFAKVGQVRVLHED